MSLAARWAAGSMGRMLSSAPRLALALALVLAACNGSSDNQRKGGDADAASDAASDAVSDAVSDAASDAVSDAVSDATPETSGDATGDAGTSGACPPSVPADAAVPAYAPTAPWNVPVCGLAEDGRSAEFTRRFWFFSNDRDADPTVEDPNRGLHRMDFGLDPATDFAPPVYDRATATTTRRIARRDGWAGTINVAEGDTVPWNPAWRAMEGADGVMIVLDRVTGQEWNFWGLVQKDRITGLMNDSQCWLQPGYSATTHLCAASANLIRAPGGAVADYRTYGGNFPSRGVRIQFYATLATPDEVASGAIRHALTMGVANPLFGPVCTPEQLTKPDAATTCGYALAPAGGIEWAGPCAACRPSKLSEAELRGRSIPEGTRFALRLTDAELTAWLDARGYTGRKRETARVFATAARDYGWFVTDTAGTASFAVSGSANPATAAAWRSLGIDDDGKLLLRGLFTRERLWMVQPAINECAGGPSRYGCPAASTHY